MLVFRKGMGVCILGFVQCVAMTFWQSEQWVQQNISPLGEIVLGMGEGSFEIMQGKGYVSRGCLVVSWTVCMFDNGNQNLLLMGNMFKSIPNPFSVNAELEFGTLASFGNKDLGDPPANNRCLTLNLLENFLGIPLVALINHWVLEGSY